MKKLILPVALFYISVQMCLAQAGRPDPGFGSHGIVRSDLGKPYGHTNTYGIKALVNDRSDIFLIVRAGEDLVTKRYSNGTVNKKYGKNGFSAPSGIQVRDAILQPDGKLIAVGSAEVDHFSHFAIVRYNADGSLDDTFSGDGRQLTDGSFGASFASSVALQPDGKILVAGYTNEDFGLARYLPDGRPDSTFSGDGLQAIDFGSRIDFGESVAVQKDGKIVVAGYTLGEGKYDAALARYNADGSPDLTFGEDGKKIPIFDDDARLHFLAMQDDGKILVAGTIGNAENQAVLITRYDADGATDSTFGIYGKQTLDPGNSSPVSISLQKDKKIIVAYDTWNGSSYDFAISRYNTDGSPDSTFSGDGKQVTDINGLDDDASAVTIQKNGRILIAGTAGVSGSGTNFAFCRYNANGSADSAFGKYGKLQDSIKQGYTVFTGTVVQKDGKVIAAGYTWNGNHFKFLVARYSHNGQPDSSFSGDGIKIISFNDGDDLAYSVALQYDGRIIVGGSTFNGINRDFAFARLFADGEYDTTFSRDGKQVIAFGTGDDYLNTILVQRNGKIWAAGVSDNKAAVLRLNADAGLDSTFSDDGKQTTDYGSYNEIKSIALQDDGKLVAAGSTSDNITLARYNHGGTLDKSFGNRGKLVVNLGHGANFSRAVALDSAGRIVLAADITYFEYAYGCAVARFSRYGRPDSTFGEDGVTVPDDIDSKATSLAIQNDGKILLGGSLNNRSSIVRINTDGTLDKPFGYNGTQVIYAGGGGDVVNAIAVVNDTLYAAGTSTSIQHVGTLIEYLLDDGSIPLVKIMSPAKNSTSSAEAKMYDLPAAGIKSGSTDIRLMAFPNPAKKTLNITTTGLQRNGKTAISVISASGVVMKVMQAGAPLQTVALDVSLFPAGVYTVRVINGNKVICKKFVKL